MAHLQDELAAAHSSAANTEQQLAAARQLLLARSAQVGAAAGLEGQLEEAAAQLGSYKAKLEVAEQEVGVRLQGGMMHQGLAAVF